MKQAGQDEMPKMRKLLIANRGEIAIRIARTARAMGIATVGIHSSDDAASLHVKHMDELRLLPRPGIAGYLDVEAIVALACEAGCDALHPGYGLLSERADLARECQRRGIAFVGPSAATLEQLGDKTSARAVAERLGVPVIAGSAPLKDAAAARALFEEMGEAPLMLKAVNGGGGRGMRVVKTAGEIETAFAQCRAEAEAAFGDGAIYAERFLPEIRHIEVQIVGDGQSVIHLWERDCSIQRRNQKLVELAPAPKLAPETRAALLAAAIRIGEACDYRGLGTMEFLVETDARGEAGFYFIETNPRIQVEHTITEAITGLDLVEVQLRLAAGDRLAAIGLESAPAISGSAVQLRINAETLDAKGQPVPSGGTLAAFAPPSGPGVRIDSYGYPGYRTNPNFDSLLAKLIIHEPSGALERLFRRAAEALCEFHISGVETNIPLLRHFLGLPDLADWSVTVRSLDAHLGRAASLDGGPERFFATAPAGAQPAPKEIARLSEGQQAIHAPMQASVHAILIAEGEHFVKGQEIAFIEAMKMQHCITAETGGTVIALCAAEGDVIDQGAPLLTYAPNGDADAVADVAQSPDPDHIRPDLAQLQARLARTLDEARPDAVKRRRGRGQRTTRENIADLCAGGDFHEYGQLLLAGQRRKHGLEKLLDLSPADGIVTGIGDVNSADFRGKRSQVAIMAYDSTVMAGTQGFFGHKKTDRMIDIAEKQGLASIFLTEGGGGRPNDDDFAETIHSGLDVPTFSAFARLRGWGPKITITSGYCFAGNAALFGTGDIRIATQKSWIGLAGPAMIEAGGLGAFDPTEIGPAPMQAEAGLLDILAEDDAQAMQLSRKVLSYFQGGITEWQASDQRVLRHAIPEDRKRVYQIRPVIETLADEGSFLELGQHFAPGLLTGFLRIEGQALAVMANNPGHLGGALDASGSTKAARFVKLCEDFAMPLLSLCDTPGFMVGPQSEAQGAVAAAADFIGAGARLTSPIFFICLRKGYGIGAQAMAGGSFQDPAFTLSWPTGEFGAMGLEGGIRLGYRNELAAQPEGAARQALYEGLVAEAYANGKALNVATFNEIDAVIDPAQTRGWIVRGMRMHQDANAANYLGGHDEFER